MVESEIDPPVPPHLTFAIMTVVILMLLLTPCIAVAEEERSLGTSPDGKFELMLVAERPDDHGWVAIKNTSYGRVIETETDQGYSYFQTDDVHASWKADSTAFAIGLRGTKTTIDTDIYFKDGEVWERLAFPPFVANILGRQGVFSKGVIRISISQGLRETHVSHSFVMSNPISSRRRRLRSLRIGSHPSRRTGRCL